MHESPETKAIRQRMEDVRRDLDEDVQEIVEGARDMGAWRSYVKSYPWVCLGIALTAGYVIVPRRRFGMHADAQALAEIANQSGIHATSPLAPPASAGSKLLALMGNLVLREVASYVGKQAGEFFVAPQPRDLP